MKDFLIAIVFGGLFLVPLLPFYVETDFFFPFITGKNFAFRIIVEIVFAAWVLLALYDKQYRPKFSWLLPALGSLLLVMFFANLLGEYPTQSFMSNFERMDGYVTLVHFVMFSVVLGSVLATQKLWSYFIHMSLGVALLVALYGLGQQAGVFEGARDRVDSRLGNAAYMAVYMLFHIFFVYYLSFKNKSKTHRVWYILIGLVFVYTLLQTGTRGTFLGLVGGTAVTVFYIALFARKNVQLRKYAIGGMAALMLLAGGFVAVRDMDFVQQGPLKRIANINLERDLEVRMTIWGIAYEGVKERPLLGWGQGNFNYVFNEHYLPELWNVEQWFDRVHNIVFDWLIAGGILGLLAYLSIIATIVYYVVVVPIVLRRESPFSVPEQAILFGLLVAYFLHNLVVFDNIISYIFYGVMIAYIHHKVAKPIPAIDRINVSKQMAEQFAIPIVVIVTSMTVYMVNVPGLLAAGDIIDALRASGTGKGIGLEEFDRALNRNSFAEQEIVEQLIQHTNSKVNDQNFSVEDRQRLITRTEQAALTLVNHKPGDARVHNFLASLYRSAGQIEKAREQAEIAHTLSPQKPILIIEQALIELQVEDYEAARTLLEEAYKLAPDNYTTVSFLAATMMFQGEVEEAKILVGDKFKEHFAMRDISIRSVQAAGDVEYLKEILEIRIGREPNNPQYRASLASLYYDEGDIEMAVAILEEAAALSPAFAPAARCFINNIEEGVDPSTPCVESAN